MAVFALIPVFTPELEIVRTTHHGIILKEGRGDKWCTRVGTEDRTRDLLKWRKFRARTGTFSMTFRGEVGSDKGPMVLQKAGCAAVNQWASGIINLPSSFPPNTLLSLLETKEISGVVVEITRNQGDKCIEDLWYTDLDGNRFQAEEVTITIGPDGETPETVIKCASSDNMFCDECQYAATSSPGWLYITSGGTTRKVCIGYYLEQLGLCCDSSGCA